MFVALAAVIAISDQLLKQYVVSHYTRDTLYPIVGDLLRIDYIHNQGGLFGFFQGTAPVFALITVAVGAVLAWLEFQSGWRSWIVTLTLGLLLGGAIGNFVDRITIGYVVDFADIGIGGLRFPYIFNIADSAVTVAICLMFGIWIIGPMIGLHFDSLVPADDSAGLSEGERTTTGEPTEAPAADGAPATDGAPSMDGEGR